MANNRLNPEQVDRNGLTATYHAAGAAAGQLNVTDIYQVNNDGRVLLHLKKSGAGDCTVTIDTPVVVDGDLLVAQRTITVPATTGDVFAGPFAPNTYNQPGTHDLEFTLSNITGLTLAVLRL